MAYVQDLIDFIVDGGAGNLGKWWHASGSKSFESACFSQSVQLINLHPN
jgi:hypothetical protein